MSFKLDTKEINIANNVKRFRQIKGYNRVELAKLLGLSNTMITNYEKGISIPPLKIIHKLCNILNVGIEPLVYGKPYDNPADELQSAGDPMIPYRNRLDRIEERLAAVEEKVGTSD